MGKYGAKRRLAAEAGQAAKLHGPGHVTTTTTLSVSPAAKKQRMNGKDENPREDSLCWSVGRVKEELCKRGLEDIGDIFEGQRIAGNVLPLITEQRLDEMGIRVLGEKLLTLEFLKEVQSSNSQYRHSPPVDAKVLNDPIHGHIELHPLCISIIDTPQFQRLRQIKQLGACYFVFPGASHNRFEHSLGVCHLAGEMGRALKHRQPELGITDKDVLCLEIAGLCHDLGHGPFSHLFDQNFIPKITPGNNWTHEQASVAMFRYLIDDNNLMEKFKECGLDETDITFICEQIAGPSVDKTEKQDWNYQGRPKNKAFLYEVVANKRNGIDVDKWDYFARDCHCLGIRNSFDHKRFIKFARVLDVEGELQICSRDKEACNLYDMFHTRQALHRRAYQHSVNKIIEHMITEAFIKANDHIKFKGENGKMLKMSEAIYDMEAYANMTDFVFQQILLSEDNNLAESRGILKRILQRRLYKCVGQTQPKPGKYLTKEDLPQITEELCEIIQTTENDGLVVDKDDIVIKVVSLDYGMKNDNPIDHVRFYSKNHPDRAVRVRKDQVSQMLPEKFSEQVVRVFVKSREEEVASRVSECFQIWCERKDMKKAKLGKEPVEMTPLLSSQGSTSSDITPMKTIEEEAEPKASDKCRTRLSF